MIETREQYEEIKLNLYFFGDDELAAHRRAWLLETIEALREVARYSEKLLADELNDIELLNMKDIVDSLPEWLLEE